MKYLYFSFLDGEATITTSVEKQFVKISMRTPKM